MNQWSSNFTPPYTFFEYTGINLSFVTLICEETLWTKGRRTADIGNNWMSVFVGWVPQVNIAVIKQDVLIRAVHKARVLEINYWLYLCEIPIWLEGQQEINACLKKLRYPSVDWIQLAQNMSLRRHILKAVVFLPVPDRVRFDWHAVICLLHRDFASWIWIYDGWS